VAERRRQDSPAPSVQGDGRTRPEDRSTIQLVRSIAGDTALLVRKEMELAKQEVTAAIGARVKAAAALAAAAVVLVLALAFLGATMAAALDQALRPWASRLIVAGTYLVLAAIAALFGLKRLKKPSLAPEETKRTVKEDVEWARAQLKR
jgi:uncharacterized membrane protein YqjE